MLEEIIKKADKDLEEIFKKVDKIEELRDYSK